MQTQYFLIDQKELFRLRPTADGGAAYEGFNPTTGRFENNAALMGVVLGQSDRDCEEITSEQFDQLLKRHQVQTA